jgi:hypothetical protein
VREGVLGVVGLEVAAALATRRRALEDAGDAVGIEPACFAAAFLRRDIISPDEAQNEGNPLSCMPSRMPILQE